MLRHAGADLGRTSSLLLEQTRIDKFAEATDDPQWIHVDGTRAASGPFGRTIAHGYLSMSLVTRFLFEMLVVTDAKSVLNYGLDRMRFPAPLLAGSLIHATGKLQDAKAVAGGVQTTTSVKIMVENGEKPVLVADVLTRFLR